MKILESILVILCILYGTKASSEDNEAVLVHFVEPGDWTNNDKSGLRIYCNNAKTKNIMYTWKTIVMNIETTLESYELYEGKSSQEVIKKHKNNQKCWKLSLFGTKKCKNLKINPFENICIGVYVSQKHKQFHYKIIISQNKIDTWKISLFVLGIFLFWYARRLSQNTLLYYICGITIGVLLSIVILIYLFGKLLPKGKFMYLMLATGYTMSFYVAQMIWDNIQFITIQYQDYVFYYIFATILISFIICYHLGPVINTRTKYIIQLIIHMVGLILVYYSSYFYEVSTSFCVMIILLYNFPVALISKGCKYWKRLFPVPRRLITEDEYQKEGIIETGKALINLREYCRSPKCDPWRTILKLKDPIRFAKFLEGDNHFLEDESFKHDNELTKLNEEYECTDDEFDN